MARITNYVDGNVLTGAQLNNEIDNIWNNGPSLISLAIPSYTAVSGLSGSISGNIGSFQAQAYQLRSTTSVAALNATSSYSINTQTVGPVANGRDQAAAFASTQVHFYAITTGGTSTNAAGVCSTKPPTVGPTLPAGYSAWAYLASAIYSTASSGTDFSGGGILLVAGSQMVVKQTALSEVLTAGGATAETDVTCGAIVPSIATAYTVQLSAVGGITPAAGGNLNLTHRIYSETGVVAETFTTIFPSTAASATLSLGFYEFTLPNVRTTPTFGYQHIVSVGTSAHMTARIVRFTCPNGDVG